MSQDNQNKQEPALAPRPPQPQALKTRYTYWLGTACDRDWPETAVTALQTNTWIDTLYLDGKRWNHDPVRQDTALRMLAVLGKNESVSNFMLWNADLNDRTLAAFSEAMEQNVAITSISLRRLSQSQNSLTVPLSVFSNARRKLQSIALDTCSIDAASCKALADLIRRGTLKSLMLTEVDFAESMQEEEEFGKAFDSLMGAIAESTTLEHLMFRGINVGSTQNVLRLLQALSLNSSLSSLILEEIAHLGGSNNTRVSSELAFLIGNNSRLRELSLRKNNLGSADINVLARQGLSQNTTLKTLHLSRNPVRCAGAVSLVQAIKQNTSSALHELSLCDAEIGVTGCATFGQNLHHMTSLVILAMDGNVGIETTAADFVNGLEQQSSINLHQILERPSRYMQKSADWRRVDFFLRLNKSGKRQILQHGDTMTYKLLPTVLANASISTQPDLLFHLIRQMPSLVVNPLSSQHQQQKTDSCPASPEKLLGTLGKPQFSGSPRFILLKRTAARPVQRWSPCA